MTVLRVSTVRVRVPFRAPFVTAARTWTARDAWLVRAVHDDGTIGWGEAILDDPAAAPALDRLAKALDEAGRAPADAALESEGAAGRALLCAVRAAAAKAPAEILPGGAGVRVNATVGATTPDEAAAEAAARVAQGFRTLKLKVPEGACAGTVATLLDAVRAAVGPSPALRLDANGTWDLDTATGVLLAAEPYGVQYVEQPLPAPDLAGMRELRGRTRVPVAADEAVTSPDAAHEVLHAGAADVLVVKPARVGGLMAVARIETMATASRVPVVVTSSLETGIGLAGGLAAAAWVARFSEVPGWPAAERDHGLATGGLLVSDLLVDPLVVRDGRAWVPGGADAGPMGITVDEAAVERFRVAA